MLSTCVLISQTEVDTVSDADTSLYVSTKSPLGALARSAILPGFGQFYNESYWKIPVIWGLGAWFGYNYYDNHSLYKDYRTLYENTGKKTDYLNREFYRDQRDVFAIYLGILYVANLVDAYVDAHLFDFNVEEDFYRQGNLYQINMRFHF